MAELYVKPGNRRRGWNDPPQFSYGLQQLRGPLARRPAPRPAGAAAAGAGEASGDVAAGAAGPAPPVPGPAGPPPPPPPAHSASWPPRRPGASPGAGAAAPPGPDADADAEGACEAEDVLPALGATLEACRGRAQKQVCDEISKRLAMLQQMWVQGNLSASVRRGMGILTQELKAQHWESADEIHRSLMVDHVAEVSQWMVGIKRLIAEAKDLHAGDLPAEDPGQQSEASVEREGQ